MQSQTHYYDASCEYGKNLGSRFYELSPCAVPVLSLGAKLVLTEGKKPQAQLQHPDLTSVKGQVQGSGNLPCISYLTTTLSHFH